MYCVRTLLLALSHPKQNHSGYRNRTHGCRIHSNFGKLGDLDLQTTACGMGIQIRRMVWPHKNVQVKMWLKVNI